MRPTPLRSAIRLPGLASWRRHRPLIGAALAALVLLVGLAGPPPRAEQNVASVAPLPPAAETDERFGLVQGIQAPALALQAGARWDRVIFPWSLIQKGGPSTWDEQYFSDAAIRAQSERGVTMVGVMIYTPQWASLNPTRGRPVDPPQGLNLAYDDPRNTWGQFVHKLAARQRGVVDHWIIWNEPDLFEPGLRYTWDGSYEEYAQLLKVAYLNIKEVNPRAKIILGGLTFWWDKWYHRPPYLGPLYEIIRRDPDARRNNDYFDIIGVHVYHAPLNAYAIPLIMREIVEERGAKKPIWIDESNAVPYADPLTPLPYPPLAATLDQQASYVVQSMALALAAGVERYAIYKALDGRPENGSELFGLIRNDQSVKPAYVAFQVGSRYFANTRSAVYRWSGSSEVPTEAEVRRILSSADRHPQFIWPAQVSQVALERGERRTTVVWNNSPEPVSYQVPATARQATLVTKDGQTERIAARDGFYRLDLPGSTHNPDESDYSIYLIGGEPFIIDEQVAPLPTDRLASRIEIVWPHGGADVKDARQVNVTAQLLMPGTDESVPCRYKPESVQLWRRLNDRPPELVTSGVRRMAERDGLRYPVWDFSDVDVSAARDQDNAYRFYVLVDGLKTDRQTWTYGGPEPDDWTAEPNLPRRSCE